MPYSIQEKNKQMAEKKVVKYEITPEGSLGLLALGAVGLRAWRKVKSNQKENQEKNKDKEDGKANS